MKFFSRKKSQDDVSQDEHIEGERLEAVQPFSKAILPVIACGAGLFSDGYINNVSSNSCTQQWDFVPSSNKN